MSMILMNTLMMMSIYTNHPLILIISLILCTLLVSMKSFTFTKISLFSYMIILLMLGGLIILFIYMASMAPNEVIQTKNFKAILILTIFIILFMMSFDTPTNYNSIKAMEILMLMYNPMIIFIAATYLFVTLVAVVKVTKIPEGPLRSNF
uniref:NADH dehydrogenase subunit 6 n=1 Tax=Opilio parietinus TaxID=121214 RepID=E3UHH6_9ARAC|nr:NADH dehydrogenase subunit 6 [Opilio parietinus]ADI92920.1 NADH dehydrogenase subunit 6 [Opilio parietinus]